MNNLQLAYLEGCNLRVAGKEWLKSFQDLGQVCDDVDNDDDMLCT